MNSINVGDFSDYLEYDFLEYDDDDDVAVKPVLDITDVQGLVREEGSLLWKLS
jgi:hypothetical protein